MSWEDIQVDDFGWVGKLTLKQDGSAVDISSYTTKKFILRNPVGATVEKTAIFDSDGTDGVLKYTILTGEIAVAGNWKVEARIAKTGAEITSNPHAFSVAERLE